MNKTVDEAVTLIADLKGLVKDTTDVEIVVSPPFTALGAEALAAAISSLQPKTCIGKMKALSPVKYLLACLGI